MMSRWRSKQRGTGGPPVAAVVRGGVWYSKRTPERSDVFAKLLQRPLRSVDSLGVPTDVVEYHNPRAGRPCHELPAWLTVSAVLGTLLTLAWLERRRPLRRRSHEPKAVRESRNLAMAGLAAAAVQLAERPVTTRLTRLVERRRLGILNQLRLPAWLRTTAACLLLDYTLYLSIWNTLLLMEVMFHHSNVELPVAIERTLARLLVTPRLHGIHHSVVPEEMNSNWSSGLTVWDALHGTLKSGIPQNQISLGVRELRHPAQVTLPKLIVMPFQDAAVASELAAGARHER